MSPQDMPATINVRLRDLLETVGYQAAHDEAVTVGGVGGSIIWRPDHILKKEIASRARRFCDSMFLSGIDTRPGGFIGDNTAAIPEMMPTLSRLVAAMNVALPRRPGLYRERPPPKPLGILVSPMVPGMNIAYRVDWREGEQAGFAESLLRITEREWDVLASPVAMIRIARLMRTVGLFPRRIERRKSLEMMRQ